MIQRIYTDTSVFGGCFDKEFSNASNRFFKHFQDKSKILVVSDLTLQELENAPKKVFNIIEEFKNDKVEMLILDKEAKYLASKYIEEKAISPKYFIDAQHIAIASVNRVDVLVSWNFKHIVNLRRIQLYNATNLKYGYPFIEIRTPREVLDEN